MEEENCRNQSGLRDESQNQDGQSHQGQSQEVQDPQTRQQSQFPFVINNRFVPHIANMILSNLDKESLLTCREVCQDWKEEVDTRTPLWSQIPLLQAVKDGRLDIVQRVMESNSQDLPEECGHHYTRLQKEDTRTSVIAAWVHWGLDFGGS